MDETTPSSELTADIPKQKPSLLQTSGIIMGLTFLSRILGLLRETIVSAVLGASVYGDAFTTAFRVPNLLRDLFAEGALSTSFQSVFSKDLRDNGRLSAYALGGLVCGTLCFGVGLLVLLGEIFAPQIVRLLAPGYFSLEYKAHITIVASKIMMPFLLFVSLGAAFMGILNAFERFTIPALAPTLFNLSTVVVGGILYTLKGGASFSDLYWLSFSTLFGGLLQSLVQWIELRKMGFKLTGWRIDWTFSDTRLKRILVMMVPSAIGLAALQVSIFVTSSFTSKTDGAMQWLSCAFRLMQLPIGLFGVAIGTVTLSKLAKEAASPIGTISSDSQDVLTSALRSVFFLAIPSAFGLYVLAHPIIEIIYQHKRFHAMDTLHTAAALRAYTLGIVAYAGVKVMVPAFYAKAKTRFPMYATFVAVVTNVISNILLYPHFGYRALAFGTSLAAVSNFLFLLIIYQKKYSRVVNKDFWIFLLKLIGAGGGMFLIVWLFHQTCFSFFLGSGSHRFLSLMLQVGLDIVVAVITYGLISVLFRIDEAREVKNKWASFWKRRLRK